jgi:Domain of unknown function (DUF4214)
LSLRSNPGLELANAFGVVGLELVQLRRINPNVQVKLNHHVFGQLIDTHKPINYTQTGFCGCAKPGVNPSLRFEFDINFPPSVFRRVTFMRKCFFAVLLVIFAFGGVFAQSPPTLRIVTETPNLPSELFYGDIKVKPIRLRPGTNTPITIDDADFFAAQHYIDFLRRFPDAPGLTHWTGEITECSDPAKRQPGESFELCRSRKRANTSAAFFLSPEFQNGGSFVTRVYWGTLGKQTNVANCPGVPQGLPGFCRPRYGDYLNDMVQVSQGIVVNDQLSPDVINANKRAFVQQFVNRAEFQAIYGSLNPTQFVDKLIETTGVPIGDSDRSALINEITTNPANKANVVFKVVDGTTTLSQGLLRFDTTYGQAFFDKEFHSVFVFMEYISYLRRNPDQEGFDFWLAKMNRYGNWVDAQMVLAFILSPEYRNRF